jgi:hypothetical protein
MRTRPGSVAGFDSFGFAPSPFVFQSPSNRSKSDFAYSRVTSPATTTIVFSGRNTEA